MMRDRSLAASLLLCWSAVVLTGCSGEKLDYETAFNLLRDHPTDPIKILFSAVPAVGQSDPKVKAAYDRLVEGHVLVCEPNPAIGAICQPGPAGEGITQAGSTDLSVTIGRWVPSVLTKISRSARGTAAGEARLTFEPTPLYSEYKDAFDVLQSSADGRVVLAEQKEGRNVRVSFVRADDGWHVDTIQ